MTSEKQNGGLRGGWKVSRSKNESDVRSNPLSKPPLARLAIRTCTIDIGIFAVPINIALQTHGLVNTVSTTEAIERSRRRRRRERKRKRRKKKKKRTIRRREGRKSRRKTRRRK